VGKAGFSFKGGDVMSNANRNITARELETLENAALEMQTISSFLTRLELTMIQGEGRRAIWNFGESLYEKGKQTFEIVENVLARSRAKKETSTKNPFKLLPLRNKQKKEG
jgi:hypothetical protein